MKYLKKFDTHTEYEAAESGLILPNVSICTQEGDVHYNPYVEPVETRVVAKFNVTDTSNPTKIGYNQYTSGFSAIEIDGVEQPSVVSAYTFDTLGEHTVKYTLTDPTSIGDKAFGWSYNLTAVTIPDSVTRIGDSAFHGCSALTSIDISDNITSIGSSAFTYCSNLLRLNSNSNGTFNFPNNLKLVANSLFMGCHGMRVFNAANDITYIGESAFANCIYLTRLNSDIDGVFNIPSGVTKINTYTFQLCDGLTSIDIPNNVTSIGDKAFGWSNNLTAVTIPDSVTSIGTQAFASCETLASINILRNTAPTIKYDTFQNVKTGGTLTVPSGSSGYDVWMGTGNYYLGKYNWTKVEQ